MINKTMSLFPRERECLYWICQGKTAEEISGILNIHLYTVQKYLRDIREKLDSTTIAQAVYKASKKEII